ncbi:MgtC/SapB family protein [Clostridium paraputrificum]|uniref:MgtC/SapB family protein n=1 Tax=Clostridium TaxID=1485 RepID=UPI003D33FE29
MSEFLYTQLELVLRILIAGVCGGLIGYERRNRLKEAGIRTHIIVAFASALMMIVSKYGFDDILGEVGVGLDPSRIASIVVSGVGFLGAGLIFVRNRSISGLTTAAGIWVTAGVGLAVGSGLYFLGLVSTLLLVIVQVLRHKRIKWFKLPTSEQIVIKVCDSSNGINYIQKLFAEDNIEVTNMRVERIEVGCIEVDAYIKLPSGYNVADLMKIFTDNPLIKSVEI